jgi:hypothetical protein
MNNNNNSGISDFHSLPSMNSMFSLPVNASKPKSKNNNFGVVQAPPNGPNVPNPPNNFGGWALPPNEFVPGPTMYSWPNKNGVMVTSYSSPWKETNNHGQHSRKRKNRKSRKNRKNRKSRKSRK